MKYKIVCQSPLLQYTLKQFLKEYISNNGTIITDNPEIDGILIGRDIKKPFTKTTLFMALENMQPTNKETLEEKIDKAFEEFKQNLLDIIKEYNGKE